MTGEPLRVLVVDDQPMARERLLALLALAPDVEVLGTCGSGLDAVSFIRQRRPDLVFLDMQMPELDGLGVVEQVGPEHMPLTIFVTAYDEYAVQAFEAQALDYLLKPFARPRFEKALERARRALEASRRAASAARLLQMVTTLGRDGGTSDRPRLMIKAGGRVSFVDVQAIEWVESAGNYARIHAGVDTHLVRDTMADLAQRLEPAGFFRVHRTAIVNLSRVVDIRVAPGGDYAVALTSGALVPVGRTVRDALQRTLAGAPDAGNAG